VDKKLEKNSGPPKRIRSSKEEAVFIKNKTRSWNRYMVTKPLDIKY